jgi:hypothetical protein
VRRPEAKDSPLARPFGGQVGEANNAHAVGKNAVDSGFDEVGGEEGERERQVHFASAALLGMAIRLLYQRWREAQTESLARALWPS